MASPVSGSSFVCCEVNRPLPTMTMPRSCFSACTACAMLMRLLGDPSTQTSPAKARMLPGATPQYAPIASRNLPKASRQPMATALPIM